MLFGSLVHCLSLQPEKFNSEYFVSDVRKDARTKAYQEVLELAGNKEVISSAEHERARKVAESFCELIHNEGYSDLEYEHSYFYKGPAFATKVKARFDAFSTQTNSVVDLKTMQNLPTYDEVIKTVINFDYHIQAAFYMDIREAVTGVKPNDFVFVFSQTEFPYASVSYKMSEDFITAGRNEYQAVHDKLYRSFKDISEANFPKIEKTQSYLELPKWYHAKQAAKEGLNGLVL